MRSSRGRQGRCRMQQQTFDPVQLGLGSVATLISRVGQLLISAGEKSILAALAARGEGRAVVLSRPELAQAAGRHISTVSRLLGLLVSRGLLEIVRHGRESLYRVDWGRVIDQRLTATVALSGGSVAPGLTAATEATAPESVRGVVVLNGWEIVPHGSGLLLRPVAVSAGGDVATNVIPEVRPHDDRCRDVAMSRSTRLETESERTEQKMDLAGDQPEVRKADASQRETPSRKPADALPFIECDWKRLWVQKGSLGKLFESFVAAGELQPDDRREFFAFLLSVKRRSEDRPGGLEPGEKRISSPGGIVRYAVGRGVWREQIRERDRIELERQLAGVPQLTGAAAGGGTERVAN